MSAEGLVESDILMARLRHALARQEDDTIAIARLERVDGRNQIAEQKQAAVGVGCDKAVGVIEIGLDRQRLPLEGFCRLVRLPGAIVQAHHRPVCESRAAASAWGGARFPETAHCATDRKDGGRAWTEIMGWNRV